MSDQGARETTTVTRGGQVVVIISSIKTEQVESISLPSPTRMATLSETAVVSDTDPTSVGQALTSLTPTTLITSTRANTPPPVIIVTQVVTLTALPTSPFGTLPVSTDETSSIYTRAQESRPPGIPFPAGPFVTSEGSSPLETGGVHTPQEQFNGLAASPGVIIGTFAALIGVGILLCFGCWMRRKRHERKLKMAGCHPGSVPPVLPPINRYLNSPVWFGKRSKGNSTELKSLQPTPSGPAAGLSTPTAPHPIQPKSPRQGVIGNVHKKQLDPGRDILSTGTTADQKGTAPRQRRDKLDKAAGKENTAPVAKSPNGEIGMACAQPEASNQGPSSNYHPLFLLEGVAEMLFSRKKKKVKVIIPTRSQDLRTIPQADGATMLQIEKRHLARIQAEDKNDWRIPKQKEIIEKWELSEKERIARDKARQRHEASLARGRARRAKARKIVNRVWIFFGQGYRTPPDDPDTPQPGTALFQQNGTIVLPVCSTELLEQNQDLQLDGAYRNWDEELSRQFAFDMDQANTIRAEIEHGHTEGSTVEESSDEDRPHDVYYRRTAKGGLAKIERLLGVTIEELRRQNELHNQTKQGQSQIEKRRVLTKTPPNKVPGQIKRDQVSNETGQGYQIMPLQPYTLPGELGPLERAPTPPQMKPGWKMPPRDPRLPPLPKPHEVNGWPITGPPIMPRAKPLEKPITTGLSPLGLTPEPYPLSPHMTPGYKIQSGPDDTFIPDSKDLNPPKLDKAPSKDITLEALKLPSHKHQEPSALKISKPDPKTLDTGNPIPKITKDPKNQQWFAQDSLQGLSDSSLLMTNGERKKLIKLGEGKAGELPTVPEIVSSGDQVGVKPQAVQPHKRPTGTLLQKDEFFRGKAGGHRKRISADSDTLGAVETEYLYRQCGVVKTPSQNPEQASMELDAKVTTSDPTSAHDGNTVRKTPDQSYIPDDDDFQGQAEFIPLNLTLSRPDEGLTLAEMLASEALEDSKVPKASRLLELAKNKPSMNIRGFFHLPSTNKKLTGKGRSEGKKPECASEEVAFDMEHYETKREGDPYRDSGITGGRWQKAINQQKAAELIKTIMEENRHPADTFKSIGGIRHRPPKRRQNNAIDKLKGFVEAPEGDSLRHFDWHSRYKGGIKQSERQEQMNLEKRLEQREREAKGLLPRVEGAPPKKIIYETPKMPRPYLPVAVETQRPFDPMGESVGIKLPTITSSGASSSTPQMEREYPKAEGTERSQPLPSAPQLSDQWAQSKGRKVSYSGLQFGDTNAGPAPQGEPVPPTHPTALSAKDFAASLMYNMPLTCDMKKMAKPEGLQSGWKSHREKIELRTEGIRDGLLMNAIVKTSNVRAGEGDDSSSRLKVTSPTFEEEMYIMKFNYDVIIELERLARESGSAACVEKVVQGAADMLDIKLPPKAGRHSFDLRAWLIREYHERKASAKAGIRLREEVKRKLEQEKLSSERKRRESEEEERVKSEQERRELEEQGKAELEKKLRGLEEQEKEELERKKRDSEIRAAAAALKFPAPQREIAVNDIDGSHPGSRIVASRLESQSAKANPSTPPKRPPRESPQSGSSVKTHRRRSSLGSGPASPAPGDAYLHSIPEDFLRQHAQMANARILERDVQAPSTSVPRRRRS
ncbi:hypothetical protein TWF281_006671 [Arthrobotrys megalospora]